MEGGLGREEKGVEGGKEQRLDADKNKNDGVVKGLMCGGEEGGGAKEERRK